MVPPRIAASLLALCALGAVDDDAPPPGMDVLPLIRAAAEAVTSPEPPIPGRPWSDDLAALTDSNPSAHAPAIGRLVRRGPVVLDDLGVMAGDRDWSLRSRIVRVAAGIGGEAGAPLTLRLSHDQDARVRRLAIVGLGRCRGEAVLGRLLELLASLDGDERAHAAPSLAALAEPRAIPALCGLLSDPDGPARLAQANALRQLCALRGAMATVSGLLGELGGERRRALLEAIERSSDTRLCPALVRLIDDREALAVLLAVRALATAGDARAVGPLVRLATSERLPELREAAAATLRVLTPYRAGPGQAWTLWWRDNETRWQRLAARDALLAELSEPGSVIPAGLADFPPEELAPLVDFAIAVRPCPAWLPARAVAALRAQGGERWVQPLASMIDNAPDAGLRLDLLLLLDEIGGHAAKGEFERQREGLFKRDEEALERWKKDQVRPPDTSAEHALIALALERRKR